MEKKNFLFFGTVLLLGVLTISLVPKFTSQSSSLFADNQNEDYGINILDSKNWTSSYSSQSVQVKNEVLYTKLDNSVLFEHSNLSTDTNEIGILYPQGYICNVDSISGLTSLNLIFNSEGNLTIEYGWEIKDNAVDYVRTDTISKTNNKFNFNSKTPSFFKISNQEDTPIELSTLTIQYSCIKEETTPKDYYFDFFLSDSRTYYSIAAGKNCALDGDIEIPSSHKGLPVIGIIDYGFANQTKLTGFYLTSSFSFIGNHAFEGCSNLDYVDLWKGVNLIGEYAFSYCTSLRTFSLNYSIGYVGSYAFSYCASLMRIYISEDVLELDAHLFTGCNPDVLQIFCLSSEKEDGWNDDWNDIGAEVIWEAGN